MRLFIAQTKTQATMDFFLRTKAFFVITLIALSLTPDSGYAQTFTKTNYGAQGGSVFFKIDPMEEQRDGSPYFSDEWKSGSVYNSNRTFAELQQMKYNIEKDELIFLHEGQQYIVPGKHLIERFTLANEGFVKGFDGRNTSFYLVVQAGKQLSLVKKYTCHILKGSPSKGYIPATKDRYELKESYFLMRPNNDVLMINPRKGNSLLGLIDQRGEEVDAFIRTNKLKMNKVEDLSEVLKYYNSLFQ
jgi:hypothetical protein